ncbi:probable histone-lysine N-methyltransferase set-23 [Rhagoletis pomonella]|uniref:probable histone-lysine N-methyltransferase set-23 n=1 Tax=Rhagoletis pomonella TaxID=28610 RepID=UPI0017866951|nr:probable histone-lysine N-methyltransferase set-23 [Rhagoletis pomonella]
MEVDQTAFDICDDHEHNDLSVDYVLENVLSTQEDSDNCEEYQQLKESYNSVLINGCQCNENKDSCVLCLHSGNYVFDLRSKELVLDRERSKELIYECNYQCECDPIKCLNRLVQKGPRKGLKIINSEMCYSKGLITTKLIPQGGFICEYAGEILTHNEALRRQKENMEASSMNYILFLNERNIEDKYSTKFGAHTTIIDPCKRGNIGRYLNHSCNPNCEARSVRVDCPIPKIGIFAKRSIIAGEELCFHYNEGLIEVKEKINLAITKRTICLCGAPNCLGYLPTGNL